MDASAVRGDRGAARSGRGPRLPFGPKGLAGLAAAAALVALLFDPLLGNLLVLHGRKMAVKHQVARHIVRGVADDGLVLLKFTKEESRTLLRWEHPREFEFDGQMYDIVETIDLGDSVHYRCWWDKAETALNERLRALALRALGESPKLGGERAPLLPDLKPFCRIDAGGIDVPRPAPAAERLHAPAGLYGPVFLTPPAPPPWTA